jgi:hypothetical protein
MRINAKRIALAAALLSGVAVPFAWGAGVFQTYPIIGGAAYCASGNVSGNAQGSITGQGGVNPGANVTTGTTICGQTVPAGPPALTGTEVFPVDLFTPGTNTGAGGPATADLPVTALGNGYGTSQVITTNTSVVVANGVARLISNQGTATIASVTLPPNPMQNQSFCITNAGSGVLSLTSIVVGTTGQVFVQGAAPASLAIQTNNAAAAALSTVCWNYNVANTTWYRTN